MRLPEFIRIEGASDDACVLTCREGVETEEVFAIVRDDRTAFGGGKSEHFTIGDTAAAVAGIARCEHIVPEHTEMSYDAQRIVFVRVNRRHHLSLL